MLQGIKRELGNSTKRKDPLLPTNLKRNHTTVDHSDPIQRAVLACIVFAFRSLLRKSNLLPDSCNAHCLKRGDISFHQWGLTAHVISIKTIQHKERTLDIPIASAPGSILGAAELLTVHFKETGSARHCDYLFMRRACLP